MKAHQLKQLGIGIALASLFLTGCGSNSESDEVTVESDMKDKTEAARTATTETGSSGVSNTGYTKPGSPIDLKYEVPKSSAPGSTVEISLNLQSTGNVDDLIITIAGGNDVELLSESEYKMGTQKQGDNHAMSVKVISWKPGTQFVNVFAQTRNGDNTLRRSFAVPVYISGKAIAEKSNGSVTETPDGEVIISMPAEETKN